MSFQIEIDKENIHIFISTFSSIGLINNTVTLICSPKKIYILNMDESYISVIDLVIKKTFFKVYDLTVDKLKLTFNVHSFLKILNCFFNSDENLTLCCTEKQEELIIQNSNKLFSLILFSEHNDELEIPKIEYPIMLELESSILKTYIKELSIYNSGEFDIHCENNNVSFFTNSEEGKIKIKLVEKDTFNNSIQKLKLEEHNFNLSYNLKYFEKFCKYNIDKIVKLSISSDFPMIFEYKYKDIRLRYYLSSLIKEAN